MGSPVGHTLAGIALGRWRAYSGPSWWKVLLISVAFANAPDLDWLPGFFLGQPARFHQGITHSLAFGLALSLAVSWVLSRVGWPFRTIFPLLLVSFSSHLILDMLTPDGRPPLGIPLIWPISDQVVLSPVSIFPSVRHVASSSASIRDWIEGVLVWRNATAIALELVLLLPVIGYVEWRRARRVSEAPPAPGVTMGSGT